MPHGRVLTEEIKKRITELAGKGLSDPEIAGALKIDTDTVRKYKGEKTDVQQNKVDPGPVKADRERRHRASRKRDDQKEGEPACPNSQYPTTDGDRINFVGGKKHGGEMTKDGNNKEDFEYECPACHHQWNGNPAECPKCHKLLQE
jgi:hypothetical protein